MNLRAKLQRFGVRLVICFLVLGAGYILIFGIKPTSHNKPKSLDQKLAGLRSDLDETYIIGNDLSSYKQSNAITGYTLEGIFSQYKSAISNLGTALSSLPKNAINSSQRETLKNILSLERQAASTYTTSYTSLSQVIAYDPATDLGSFNASHESTLASEATAAQKGLNSAINYTPPTNNSGGLAVQSGSNSSSILTAKTKSVLSAEAACFGKITSQINNRQTSQASITLSQCTDAYPSVRLQAVQNIVGSAFDSNYTQYINQVLPPLLDQIDQLIKS